MMKSCDSLIDPNYDFELNFNIQDNKVICKFICLKIFSNRKNTE